MQDILNTVTGECMCDDVCDVYMCIHVSFFFRIPNELKLVCLEHNPWQDDDVDPEIPAGTSIGTFSLNWLRLLPFWETPKLTYILLYFRTSESSDFKQEGGRDISHKHGWYGTRDGAES